jgi:uncharacterized protein (DUF433 family)
MDTTFAADAMPLRAGADGVIRVGNTRVTLDTVISAFSSGATAEEIVQQYPSLGLADVYQVIAYYLRRPQEVRVYLDRRQAWAAALQKENEVRFDPQGLRERLLGRGPARGN